VNYLDLRNTQNQRGIKAWSPTEMWSPNEKMWRPKCENVEWKLKPQVAYNNDSSIT